MVSGSVAGPLGGQAMGGSIYNLEEPRDAVRGEVQRGTLSKKVRVGVAALDIVL